MCQAGLPVCLFAGRPSPFRRPTRRTRRASAASVSGHSLPACGQGFWFTSAVPSTHPLERRAEPTPTPSRSIAARLARYDWAGIRAALDADGYARLPGLLTASDCEALSALYPERERFRSFIDMGPRRYGEGTYRYFAHPLPARVRSLRTQLYRRLAPVANAWNASLGGAPIFPARLAPFLARCREAGQRRPTPLLLRYETGGFNCVHQDVYGEVAFPLQVACLLSRSPADPKSEFEGGEFILCEQRPRQQTRVEAIALSQGEGLIFANQFRPIEGPRGTYRAVIKHGVSRVRSGERTTLGIIFHDAQ